MKVSLETLAGNLVSVIDAISEQLNEIKTNSSQNRTWLLESAGRQAALQKKASDLA